MVTGRIAVLLGQADEGYQRDFVSGIMQQAFEMNYDVCVFSMYIKYQNSKEREAGESNIYNLINYDLFDGVIILSDTIQTPGINEKIEEHIHEVFDGPVVCVDTDSKYFYSFWTDGYDVIYKIVSHMIEEHGLKDMAFLTGRKKHIHSIRRLEAYKKAMEDYGFEVRDDRVFYGDFWYTSGTGCAERLLRDRDNLPEAVICANDCMAIGLADELTRNGIRIPEDIAVAGYGATEEGKTCPKSLTSGIIPAKEYGAYSVICLMDIMKGREVSEFTFEADFYRGESCGCTDQSVMGNRIAREEWANLENEEGYFSMHNYLHDDIFLGNSLEEYINIVYENIFQLEDVDRLSIALNQEWLEEDKLFALDNSYDGYSDKMLDALSYYKHNSGMGRVGGFELFDSKQMLPDLDYMSTPRGYVFTPLYMENITFGYAMVSYGENPRAYDETFRLWIRTVSRGLEVLRRNMVIDYYKNHYFGLKDMVDKQSNDKKVFGRIKDKELSADEIRELEEVERILNHNLLTYHFQPIVNAVDGEIYSYEALMRSDSEWKIPPLQIIKQADKLNRLADVEKATFINVLDIIDKNKEVFEGKKVFINSIPGSGLQEDDYNKLKNLLGKHSDYAVVEITEQAELHDAELSDIKSDFNDLGIELAVDDYGTGYSNISNLLRYMPDYVKIDRSLLTDINDSSQKQHFVRETVEFCHANNIRALAEGVETSEELATVIRLGVDFIQGYYVSRPLPEIVSSVDSNVKMEINRYHREMEDGSADKAYIAGQFNRINLSSIIKDNIKSIVIGDASSTFRDITIVGAPGISNEINLEVLEGYDGRIIIENVNLTSIKNRPCIKLAENSSLTLRLNGTNSLNGGGIMVPESSRITFEGDGDLNIKVAASENYGIGNEFDKRHGLIEFYQDGEIFIESKGKTCVGIGSGEGGDIRINKGKYTINVNGDDGVGLGSFRGGDNLIIHDCDLQINTVVRNGVCLGTYEKNISIDAWRSLIQCTAAGKNITAVGTFNGEYADIFLHDMSMTTSVRADYSTGLGSYNGTSKLVVETAAYVYQGMGKYALAYGGKSENSGAKFNNADIIIDLKSDGGVASMIKKENSEIKYSRCKMIINGEEQSVDF